MSIGNKKQRNEGTIEKNDGAIKAWDRHERDTHRFSPWNSHFTLSSFRRWKAKQKQTSMWMYENQGNKQGFILFP